MTTAQDSQLSAEIAREITEWGCTDRHCDGIKYIICRACGREGHGNCYGQWPGGETQLPCDHLPDYENDIALAWYIVELFQANGYAVEITAHNQEYCCRIGRPEEVNTLTVISLSDSASRAICLSALRMARSHKLSREWNVGLVKHPVGI